MKCPFYNNSCILKPQANLPDFKLEHNCKGALNACSFFANEILDFVYIDGAHDYNSAYKDIVSWKSKVKKGGLLMGHDEYAIKKALKDAGIIVVEVFKDSSWVSIVD